MAASGGSPGKEAEPSTVASKCSSRSTSLLKQKILDKRRSRGLGEIQLDFTPKSPQPLTNEESEKLRRRKECNRKSANRCRLKEKEQRIFNTQAHKEETSRNKKLSRKLDAMIKDKQNLLNMLLNRFNVPLDVISQRLNAISFENKTLQSTLDGMDENQQSVFYLQNSEQRESYSENSSSSYTNIEVEQSDLHDMHVEAYETVIGSDVTTGSYASTIDWDSASATSSVSSELQIVEADGVEDVEMDGNEVVTVYVCYREDKADEERIYTNL